MRRLAASFAVVAALVSAGSALPARPGFSAQVDNAWFVRGVGTVLEQTVKGGNERNELISVSR